MRMIHFRNHRNRVGPAARRYAVLCGLTLAGLGTLLVAEGPARPLHRDGKSMGQATMAVSRGLIFEDAEMVRKALEELGHASPPLKVEEREIFGREIYDADRAFHLTLVRAREYAALGDIAKMFDEYVWVQRTCMNCHGISRKQGLLAAEGPIGQPAP
jgi:hypothetical protein